MITKTSENLALLYQLLALASFGSPKDGSCGQDPLPVPERNVQKATLFILLNAEIAEWIFQEPVNVMMSSFLYSGHTQKPEENLLLRQKKKIVDLCMICG
uniref:Secreted protein n=1 Tax=Cacopsylla melanoneura TaxID=428564 RepID=A0A8D8Z3M2_9HEMI